MKYEEAKEQLALKKHKTTYRTFYLTAGFPDIIKLNDEAAKLYARSVADKSWEAGSARATFFGYPGIQDAPDKETFMKELFPEPDNIISGSTLTDVGRYKARNNGE